VFLLECEESYLLIDSSYNHTYPQFRRWLSQVGVELNEMLELRSQLAEIGEMRQRLEEFNQDISRQLEEHQRQRDRFNQRQSEIEEKIAELLIKQKAVDQALQETLAVKQAYESMAAGFIEIVDSMRSPDDIETALKRFQDLSKRYERKKP